MSVSWFPRSVRVTSAQPSSSPLTWRWHDLTEKRMAVHLCLEWTEKKDGCVHTNHVRTHTSSPQRSQPCPACHDSAVVGGHKLSRPCHWWKTDQRSFLASLGCFVHLLSCYTDLHSRCCCFGMKSQLEICQEPPNSVFFNHAFVPKSVGHFRYWLVYSTRPLMSTSEMLLKVPLQWVVFSSDGSVYSTLGWHFENVIDGSFDQHSKSEWPVTSNCSAIVTDDRWFVLKLAQIYSSYSCRIRAHIKAFQLVVRGWQGER